MIITVMDINGIKRIKLNQSGYIQYVTEFVISLTVMRHRSKGWGEACKEGESERLDISVRGAKQWDCALSHY